MLRKFDLLISKYENKNPIVEFRNSDESKLKLFIILRHLFDILR